MIVVSEIGARLSPRMAPEMIAPASAAGEPPKATPAGKKIGNAVNMVPIEDPVDIAMEPTARKVNTVKAAPPIPRLSASQTKPPDRPDTLMSSLYMPITNRMTMIVTEAGLAMPRMADCQNASQLRAKGAPASSPTKAPMASAFMSNARNTEKRAMDVARNTSSGTKLQPQPHRKVSSCAPGSLLIMLEGFLEGSRWLSRQ